MNVQARLEITDSLGDPMPSSRKTVRACLLVVAVVGFFSRGETSEHSSTLDLGLSQGSFPEVLPIAEALNDRGQVVGSCLTDDELIRVQACLWQNGAWTPLGNLGGDAAAFSINAKGQVVGTSL